MIQDVDNLSRSVSQHEQPDQSSSSSVGLRNQSSCSSLTSGIGQSDQSCVSNCDKNTCNSTSGQGCNNEGSCPALTTSDYTTNQYHEVMAPIQSGRRFSSSQYSVPNTSNTLSDSPHTQTEKGEDKLREDLKQFVDIIFTDSQSVSLEKKAEFGKLMRTPEARLLFAMFVDDYRVNSKRVSELTFYSLAQYFSIVLLECLLAEDFRPAKIIMNMMFTYYYEQSYDKIPSRDRPQTNNRDNDSLSQATATGEPRTIKTYLYTLLKDQEIFKSIRFWTSAFYESVIIERNNHPVFIERGPGKLSNEKRVEELDCSKNITFGLLGSFIHNMCLLELSHEFCQEFLDKHSTIAGLSDDQLEMLRSNLVAMFNDDETASNNSIMSQTAKERLSSFLHKLSSKLNNPTSSQAQTR